MRALLRCGRMPAHMHRWLMELAATWSALTADDRAKICNWLDDEGYEDLAAALHLLFKEADPEIDVTGPDFVPLHRAGLDDG